MVVSATPAEALQREWTEHDLARYTTLIAGQEMGTKKEHIAAAIAKGGYGDGHVLMVGDALGDCRAAKANGALFYPINPGREEDSWKRLLDEGLERFFAGGFAGAYEEKLLEEFNALLPEIPPWKN